MSRPQVTVAIPLHRSAAFADVVSANLTRLPADVEILVSDRTRLDDTLTVLAARHHDDPRITWLRAPHGLGWVDHYNDLLRRARGTYVCWMPHDDDFPADYVPLLAAALDAHPDALVAFGRIESVDLDGGPLPDRPFQEPPFPLGVLPRRVEAVRLAREWNLGIPIRGLLRRDALLVRRLVLRHEPHDQWVDQTWALAVLAAGPMVYEPRAACTKRYYPGSTHTAWPARSSPAEFATVAVMARALAAARVPPRDAAAVLAVTLRRSTERALWALPAPVADRVPARARAATAAWFRRGR